MSNFLNKIRVKTATEQSNHIHNEAIHNTTGNFMETGIGKCIWLTKGKHTLRWQTYSNMQPLPQPTFGKIKFANRLYWVPFRTIFKGWNDFIVDNMHVNGNNGSAMLATTPYTNIKALSAAILNKTDSGTAILNDGSYYNTLTSTTVYYVHTKASRRIMKILYGLYGKFPINPLINTINVSMLPLLAYLKIYLDYYYNNAYKNDTTYLTLKSYVERDNNDLFYTDAQITYICDAVGLTFYDTDMFTGCWDNPNHPNITNQESTFTLNDPNGAWGQMTLASNSTGTPMQENVNNADGKDPQIGTSSTFNNTESTNRTISRINQWGLNTLKALTDYLKRHQLAGASTLQRYISRFGVGLSTEQLSMAQELGAEVWETEITPIFSNSDTAASGGESLGSYAAVAQAAGQGKTYTLETNEYGILLGISTIIPEVNNVDGMDGMAFCLTKLDFWTPEFDNIGVDMITAAELVTSNEASRDTNSSTIFAQGFGFMPRYCRWKTLRDSISGDYTVKKFEDQYDRYMLNRKISKTEPANNYVHSKAFTQGSDADQYNKIFYGYDGKGEDMDFFNIIHRFTLDSTTPMKPLYDYYDWEHEGGQEMEMQNNGALRN